MSLAAFLSAYGMVKFIESATSNIYASKRLVAKHVIRYQEFDSFDREICILNKLRTFSWAPTLFCIGSDYFVTHFVGDASCSLEAQDYARQMRGIVHDMQSVGVRHNDLFKPYSSDFVTDSTGRLHLTDFGWGTVYGRLNLTCVINGRSFESSSFRPYNRVLNKGFETKESLANTSCKLPLQKPHASRKAVSPTRPLVRFRVRSASPGTRFVSP